MVRYARKQQDDLFKGKKFKVNRRFLSVDAHFA